MNKELLEVKSISLKNKIEEENKKICLPIASNIFNLAEELSEHEDIQDKIEYYNENNSDDLEFLEVSDFIETLSEVMKKNLAEENYTDLEYNNKLMNYLKHREGEYLLKTASYFEWGDITLEFGKEMKPDTYNDKEASEKIKENLVNSEIRELVENFKITPNN